MQKKSPEIRGVAFCWVSLVLSIAMRQRLVQVTSIIIIVGTKQGKVFHIAETISFDVGSVK
ncbi:MAG TPA: hypothetical protein EYP74_01215 [Anaerolineales bacterium]|nr:hypothetical protein [Anaerolineales bacterium]